MNSEEFPLLDFFIKLRHAGLPLGIGDYQLLLKAFQGGFGVKDTESLNRICRALWVKSDDEQRLFNYHFNQIESDLKQRQARIRKECPKFEDKKIQHPENKIKPEKISETETLPKKDTAGTPSRETVSPKTAQPEIKKSEPPAVSPELMRMKDEAEAAQVINAVQADHRTIEEISYSSNRFILKGDYFPITQRQMKQTWRYLRCFVREGNRKEIDVDATVREICEKGILSEPVMVPCRINRLELLLLIDQNGSMVPFHALSQRLKETAVRGGRIGKTFVYYFHNVPGDWLYKDAALIEADRTDDVLKQLHRRYTHALIISDAGAARGSFNPERLELTLSFLNKLRACISHTAWLNPMPSFRWLGTTADEIEQHVAMFDMSRSGLDRAVTALRKQS